MEPTFPGLTGKQLCRLMRRHGVTIRELARRMGNTQKQIRHRREHGIPTFVLRIDYEEAIYGECTPRLKAAWKQYRKQTEDFR